MSTLLSDLESYLNATVVVAAEAGAAEIISSALLATGHSPMCILEEPALSIFKRKMPSIKTSELSFLTTLSPTHEFVLLGSSYCNSLERDALKIIKQQKVAHASVFDQWINFDVRFGPPTSPDIPENIWVTDEYALKEALRIGFSPSSLKIVHNYKLDEVKRTLLAASPRTDLPIRKKHLLFLSEPLSQDARDRFGDESFYGCNEKTIFQDILSLSLPYTIRIRKHPAEDPHSYTDIIKNHSIEVSTHKDVLDDIIWADSIIGIETVALVYAALAQKQVISYIPTEKYECHLPHKEILRIKTLKALSRALSY